MTLSVTPTSDLLFNTSYEFGMDPYGAEDAQGNKIQIGGSASFKTVVS
jgi:hypothetical protein